MSYRPEERLSKKEFWEECYNRELENFENDKNDIGEVWFGEDIAEQVVERLEEFATKEMKILDVGCGNGYTLSLLGKEGYQHLYGMDYSPASIKFTKKVLEQEGIDLNTVTIEQMDILEPNCLEHSQIQEMDVVIDKGTFDALMVAENQKERAAQYKKVLNQWLSKGGYFIITSCNWTEDELVNWLGEGLEEEDKIADGNFEFGGSQGSKTTTIFFKKIIN
ncbi:hypothetical protein, conserved [Entamoeba dispar SAW760]|uniref:Protein-lysine N-methyltransferase EDI_175080 n=1 Tax=Entamoeba dispar (strain ATCC PRA-260 / SAW760) TaxID=370354 RepID=B0EMM9_ENTDS|nr:uncharacterized protein EDI_175080 [Entamoeba dispar SAW760]EDR24219.1 hypothetical protein, conserved [Entamoeba dispar SAW760]|eukprot:EDR24219.1 hypothetical protein, conserved [Entamoeba dispar SAW760]